MSKCECPVGWPKFRLYRFGEAADATADRYHVSRPYFAVLAHRHPCELQDEPVNPVKTVTGSTR